MIGSAPTDPFKGIKCLSAGDLLGIKFAAREFVIDPWLRTGESALLWAATGVGKTWLTLSLAMAVAGGGRVWEWRAAKARKVLLIDGEMNIQDLQDRIRFLLDSGAVDGVDREVMRENLLIVSRQFQDPRGRFYDVTDPASQDAILRRVEAEGVDMVVVDNMTTCADGLADENDATAFRSVMGFLLKMKQANKAAILVHHANKSGADARGSTALEATFEVKLGLKRPEVSRPGQAAFVTEFGKYRAQGDNSLSPQVWTLGADGWTIRDDETGTPQKALKAVQSLQFVNLEEVADAIGCHKSTVSRALTKAVAARTITKEGVDSYFIKAREMRNGVVDEFDEDAEPLPF